MSNVQEAFGKAVYLYAGAVRDYIHSTLAKTYGDGKPWFEEFHKSLSFQKQKNVEQLIAEGKLKQPQDAIDITHFGDVILRQKDIFKPLFGNQHSKSVTWTQEIADVRHEYSHQQSVSDDDAYRALDNMARLLILMDEPVKAAEVKTLRDGLLMPAPPAGAKNQIGLQAWWKHAEPHEDIRKGQFDENTFAAKLDDVVRDDGSAPLEYRRADLFFRKTYLTKELKAVLADTLKRLAGTGGESVVQLRTPFGGGKTHALIALYHLVKHHADIEGDDLGEILKAANLPEVPRSRVAVLVGTQLEPTGRKAEDGTQLKTLWGEMAHQLGGKDGYALVKANDASGVAPGKDTLSALLNMVKTKFGSPLILMDEVLVYQARAAGVRVEGTTLQAQTFAFLQSLTEMVAGVNGAALVTTFPESHIEYYDHNEAPAVFDRLEKIFGRVQAVRVPVQGEEIYEVIRRRLFDSIDTLHAQEVVGKYLELFEHCKDDLPIEARGADYKRKMLRAYPFHPELIDLLYEQWGTMQAFQKTRGVLRLLARVVEHGWMSGAARPLITLGDVGLEDGEMQATVTQTLGDAEWRGALASDLSAPGGRSYQLDKEQGGEYAKQRLGQTVASAVFMASHSGGAQRGITKPGLNLALIQPGGITPMLINDALDRLKNRLYYMHANGSYVFRAQPNLNAVLSDRMAQVTREKALDLVKDAASKMAGSGVFKAYIWPGSYKDVPDQQGFKLVIFGPEAPIDDDEALSKAYSVFQSNAGSGPRSFKNTLVYLAGRGADFLKASDAARMQLALTDIQADRALTLSEEQKKDLKERLQRAQESVPALTKAAYLSLLLPSVDDAGKNIYLKYDVTAYTKTRPTLAAAVEDILRSEDQLIANVDPGLLRDGPWKLWPKDEATVDLKNLREYFLRLPHLPFLESETALKTAIVRGVQQGIFELGQWLDGEYVNIWDRKNLVEDRDVFFTEPYRLGRPGTLPKKEKPETMQGTGEASTGNSRTIDGNKGQSTGANSGTGDGATKPDAKSRVITYVRLGLSDVRLTQIPNLLDLFNALQDAKGDVKMEVKLTANNPGGLDQAMLDLSVKELIDQYGLQVDWHQE